MIMGLISGNIDSITEENSGGYDMIAYWDPDRPIDDINLEIEENENLSSGDFSTIVPVNRLHVAMDNILQSKNTKIMQDKRNEMLARPFEEFQENGTWYTLTGCSDEFFENSDYLLDDWDKDSYKNEEDVWNAIRDDPTLAIGDRRIMARDTDEGGPPQEEVFALRPGDQIVARDMNGNSKVITLIGFTTQSMIGGVFVRADVVTEGFNFTSYSMALIKFDEDISESGQDAISKDLEREFLANSMQTFIIKQELESMLETFTNFFYLLEAFLGLGLIVGIAGLGMRIHGALEYHIPGLDHLLRIHFHLHHRSFQRGGKDRTRRSTALCRIDTQLNMQLNIGLTGKSTPIGKVKCHLVELFLEFLSPGTHSLAETVVIDVDIILESGYLVTVQPEIPLPELLPYGIPACHPVENDPPGPAHEIHRYTLVMIRILENRRNMQPGVVGEGIVPDNRCLSMDRDPGIPFNDL
jgi:hypothetical protein